MYIKECIICLVYRQEVCTLNVIHIILLLISLVNIHVENQNHVPLIPALADNSASLFFKNGTELMY